MNEHDLELYARHVSLFGVPAQEKLLLTRIAVDPKFPEIAKALRRMGVQIDPAAPLRVGNDDLQLPGVVGFDGNVGIGPQNFSMAAHRDASAPLAVKERFFSALVASEIVLWLLDKRPAVYELHIDYPTYRVR